MRYTLLIYWLLTVSFISAQPNKMTAEQYIDEFKDEAIKEMKRTGVPASITLAQGMLESGNGNSRLAQKGNNHFGIKCHSDWTGPKIYKDDDSNDECFRKYKNAIESYRDHSDFLKNKSRYAELFDLKPTDYKGWAHGLKKAGYATNPKYPQLLIDLIEKYKLYQYDKEGGSKKKEKKKKEKKERLKEEEDEIVIPTRIMVSDNYVKYVVVKSGEDFNDIEKLTGVSIKRILKYNEREKNIIVEGEKIYLQPKKKKSRTKYHEVKEGETLYSISQEYGVTMKSIIKRNRLQSNGQVNVGQKLKLRGQKI